jgi:poly(3-hydroxybutyrate) depolymerase
MRSAGCGKSAPASQRYTIDVGGTMREYIIAIPENYDPERAYPVVFAWHPLGGSAQQVAGMGSSGYYGLRAQSDGGAIFVSPEGLAFNGGNLGWANTNGRDIAFLEAMLARFRGELCIDESRLFSTGFSFGGMMSFAVGCAMGLRAIAPMAGNIQVSGCEDGDAPVAVLGFHGLEDTVVSIDGGRDGRDVFIERNGCTEQSMPAEPSWCSGIGQNYQPCSCVSYQGCTAGYPVIWCEFTGPHTPAPSSAATIWSFFSQF